MDGCPGIVFTREATAVSTVCDIVADGLDGRVNTHDALVSKNKHYVVYHLSKLNSSKGCLDVL
jgi:hypothetical protein